MPDYSQFGSEGTIYDFSKGPKSLYYANSDEDLLGVVLNVPQTDDDDEWGGTNRIAFERIVDHVGTLQEIVIDPAGSGSGLSTRVTNIETIVDFPNDKITVNDITITGATNKITIGSTGTEFNATDLKLGANFTIVPDTNSYSIAYKTASIRLFDDDGATTPYFGITVCDGTVTTYQFKATEFIVPSGVNFQATDMTITGTLTAVQANFTGAVNAVDFVASSYLEAASLFVSGTSLFTGLVTICGANLISDSTVESSIFYTTTYSLFDNNTTPPGTMGGGRAAIFWDQTAALFKYTDGTGIHELGSGGGGGTVTATDIIATSYLETVNLNVLGSSALSGELTLCGTIKWLEPTAPPGGSPPTTARMWYDDTLGGFKYVTSLATVYDIYSSATSVITATDMISTSYLEASTVFVSGQSLFINTMTLCGANFVADQAITAANLNATSSLNAVDVVASSYLETGSMFVSGTALFVDTVTICGALFSSDSTITTTGFFSGDTYHVTTGGHVELYATVTPPAGTGGRGKLYWNAGTQKLNFVDHGGVVRVVTSV